MIPARSIQLADAVLAQLKAGTFQDGPSFERQIHPILKREELDKLKGLVIPRGDVRNIVTRNRRSVDFVIDVAIYQAVDGPNSQLDDRLSSLVKCAEEVTEYIARSSRRRLELSDSYFVDMLTSETVNGGTDLFWRTMLDDSNLFAWVARTTYRGFESSNG